MEEQLKRIADALEGIDQELSSISGSLSSISLSTDALENLDKCVNNHGQFCITGDVTNYEP